MKGDDVGIESWWRRARDGGRLGALLISALCLVGCGSVKTRGYLSHGPPRGLLFSAPPQQFSSLPPLPKPTDVEPIFEATPSPTPVPSAEPRLGVAPAQTAAAPPPDTAVAHSARRDAVGFSPAPSATGAATNQQPARTDFSIQTTGIFPPELLMRFFPDGRPASFEMPVRAGETMSFQSPLLLRPSSSAVYEVK